MKALELALRYLDLFLSWRDLDRLRPLLSDDLIFEGPFHQSDSAVAYIQTLQADPPNDCTYTITRTFEDDSGACIVYQFSKPGVSVPMAQLFETRAGKITKIRLIFDGRAFSNY